VRQKLLIALVSVVALLTGSALGASASLAATATAPLAPAGLVATPGNATIALSWTAPADGGSPITGYNLYQGTSSGGENYSTPVNGKTLITATTATVTGLANAKTYYYTVKAVNAVGPSPASNEAWAVPAATVPGPPKNVAAAAGYESATVTWAAPTSQGGSNITRYTVATADLTLASRGGQSCTWTVGPLSCTMIGLTDGDTYSFTVTATNSLGTGVASGPSNSIVPAATVAAAPTGLVATPGNGTTVLSWTAPASNGGSGVTGYNVYEGTSAGGENYSAPINGSTLVSGTTTTVTALTNTTTYYFTVKAVNGVGSSGASNEAWAIPNATLTVPGMPTSVAATAAYASAKVTWNAPSAGSSKIIRYTVTAADTTLAARGGQTCVWTTGPLTCTLTGLTDADVYTFTVVATSSVGSGLASSASNAVTPNPTVPSAPTTLTVVPSDNSAVLTWAAPPGNGAPITGYNAYEGTTAGGENYSAPVNGAVLISGTTVTVTGLTNGKTYYFTVKAKNALGSSGASNEAWAVPAPTVAPAPINVTATGGDNGTAVVTWSAPFSSGGAAITGYVVTPYSGSTPQGPRMFASAATTETVSGLNPGASYTFEVAAVNAYGTGASSAASNAIVVPRAYTILRIALSKATISYGHEQVEHISVTVAPNYPGPVPTGSVTVKKSTTTLCVVKLSAAKGSCTLTGSALPTGAYGVYATYSRNADFVGSTAPKETLTVARATTTTTLTLSTAKVTLGHEQAARFSVTVGDSFAAGPKPAGTVTIKKSTTTLCVIKLSAGKGSCTMAGSKLQPRSYSVYATYGRTSDFVGSTSTKKTLTVVK
jgi:titin